MFAASIVDPDSDRTCTRQLKHARAPSRQVRSNVVSIAPGTGSQPSGSLTRAAEHPAAVAVNEVRRTMGDGAMARLSERDANWADLYERLARAVTALLDDLGLRQ